MVRPVDPRVATRELPDLETLHARLLASCPSDSGSAIVHGDLRVDNAILDADGAEAVRALVDWEMSTLGDPLADLALARGLPRPRVRPGAGRAAAGLTALGR